jgi:hypothetical protein
MNTPNKKALYSKASLKRASRHSFLNEQAIKASEKVGCYSCCKVYPSDQVKDWITERSGGKTAICPHCRVDAVLRSRSGYPLTPDKFLSAMEAYWFNYH